MDRKAFESPLLANHMSNLSGRQLAKATEGIRTQYGPKRGHSAYGSNILAFGHLEEISPPGQEHRSDG
jgi:hypothetical protein